MARKETAPAASVDYASSDARLKSSMRPVAAVRPYPRRIRNRVFEFLHSLGYEVEAALDPATSDEDAIEWLGRQNFELLLLPFHLHRDKDGVPVDGIGVALNLPRESVDRGVPILMPVSEYSMQASFERRLEQLKRERPDVSALLIPMPESKIGHDEIKRQLKSLASRTNPPSAQ